MNNSRLSPIISLLIVLLSSVIIDTHARYHHTEVLPRRHRHRHHSPSSSSLNSVSHRHNANSQHEGKKSPPLYEDTLAYEELYEDSDYPEDYESLEEDYNYEDYEVRPRRRRFRDHSRFANYRGSRLNRRRFFVRERNFEPDYYDEDYNYNHNHNHNHNRNRNFKVEELEIPRRHRKDFVKRRPSFGPRKGYGVRRQTGRKIPDYDSEEEFEFDRDHKKKHNLTGNNNNNNNNNNVNFVHEKDKEVDKEEEDNEEEDIWKETDEADDEEEEDDEEDKSFDDKDFMKMEDNNYFYKGAKREYRNINVNGSRGVVRKEVRSVSSSEEFRKEKGFENSSFREKPMKIRVRDEDYDRRNLQSDTGEEPEEEEETSAPITISAPKSTTMMSTAAVSTTALASASRPVITGQTYERRDSQFSDPTSSSSSPTSHGTHKVPVKEIKSLPGNNNANKSGKSAEIREALQHAMKVSREGSCQWPRARVIPVRDVYPSPSTTYIPHCAILHRCSDDTGCCRSESLTCVPKQFHKVELYFYTTSIGGGSVVEKLSFYNHTECECREKTEYGMQNDNKVQESNEFKSHVSSGRQHQSLVPQNIRKPVTKKPCRCPSEFTPRMNFDGECVCDCFENDQNCFRARRGKGYFSYRDRLCIQNEECAVPSCEFGDYIKRQGRCPRKKEKFDEIANYPNHMNYHNRHRS